MARVLRSTAVAAALAAAVLLALPTAAQASTIYPPSDSCSATPATVAPGGSVEFSCKPDTFSSKEPVTVTVTGESGSEAGVGMVRLVVGTASGQAQSQADGSLAPVKITFPSSARGTYNLAAVSATSAGGTAAATVTNADGTMPGTGLDSSSLTGLWIGGGALVGAGAILAIVAAVRRTRSHRD